MLWDQCCQSCCLHILVNAHSVQSAKPCQCALSAFDKFWSMPAQCALPIFGHCPFSVRSVRSAKFWSMPTQCALPNFGQCLLSALCQILVIACSVPTDIFWSLPTQCTLPKFGQCLIGLLCQFLANACSFRPAKIFVNACSVGSAKYPYVPMPAQFVLLKFFSLPTQWALPIFA